MSLLLLFNQSATIEPQPVSLGYVLRKKPLYSIEDYEEFKQANSIENDEAFQLALALIVSGILETT